MNRTLMKAIIYLAAFLELSDDDMVDPDAATKQLENLSGILQQLTIEERDEFVEYLQEFAVDQEQLNTRKEFVDFLLMFAEAFGLKD